MKKIIGICIVTLLTLTISLPATGIININNKEYTEYESLQENIEINPTPKPNPLPLPIWSYFNPDWNYWSYSPDMYAIPANTGDEYVGKVGIGTDDPLFKLDIRGPVGIMAERSGTHKGCDTMLYIEAINGTSDYCYQIHTSSYNGSNFVVTNSGRVGINTRYPETDLHVKNQTSPFNNALMTLESDVGEWRLIVTGSESTLDPGMFIIKNQKTGENVIEINEDGKVTIRQLDPDYISYSKESHESIREYSRNVEDHEAVMQFWNGEAHRMEIYDISQDAFYTFNGELIG